MRFEVTRTSLGSRRPSADRAPCDEATFNSVAGVWEIEIDTLDELVSLLSAKGWLVLSKPGATQPLPGIEIYDDYRE